MPNDELRLDFSSKCPERFSLSVWAKPESLLDTGVVGMGGKFIEIGDTDDGGLPLLDLLVGGRSDLLWSTLAWEKALNTGGRTLSAASGSPKDDEFCATHFPRELGGVIWLKSVPFSAENASYGNDSIAYGGAPGVTPYRSLWGAATCKRERSFRRCWRGKLIGCDEASIVSLSRSTRTKSSSGNSTFSYRLSMPTM